MSSALTKQFGFEGVNVRVVVDGAGEPWWVAKDVCEALGLANSREALARLDEDEKGVVTTDTLSGGEIGDVSSNDVSYQARAGVRKTQTMATINESGLYALILTSRAEGAKRFKKWVTSVVLPSIRKTGSYVTPQAQGTSREEGLVRSIMLIKDMMMGIPGVRVGILNAGVLSTIQKTIGIPCEDFRLALPPADKPIASMNATAIGQRMALGAKEVNRRLYDRGFLRKNARGEWEITEEGQRYGEMLPYDNKITGHAGYQALWNDGIIMALR